MILGALLDAGLSVDLLKREISKLNLTHYELSVEQVLKNGLGASQARVVIDQDHHRHHHRRLSQIKDIIGKSELDAAVKQKSTDIFVRLAEAEARVHRTEIEAVHFHEVGAMVAIIDVVGIIFYFSIASALLTL